MSQEAVNHHLTSMRLHLSWHTISSRPKNKLTVPTKMDSICSKLELNTGKPIIRAASDSQPTIKILVNRRLIIKELSANQETTEIKMHHNQVIMKEILETQQIIETSLNQNKKQRRKLILMMLLLE